MVGTAGAALHLDLQEEALLNTFMDVLNADGRLPPATHGVEQHIGTNGRPVTAKFQRLDSSKLATRPLGGPPPVSAPPPALSSEDFVFIKREAPGPPLSPLYDSPYRVLARGPKVFTLELGGRQERVTVDRLKPCLATERGGSCCPPSPRPPTQDFFYITLSSGLHSGGGGMSRPRIRQPGSGEIREHSTLSQKQY